MKKKILLFLVTLAFFVTSGCQSSLDKNNVSDINIVNKLYQLKDTYIGDSSNVRTIIDLANNTEYKVENIELKTNTKPFRIVVNFAVDNRANYRYIDDNGLNRMSGLIFSLVPNADEILYMFYDDFSDKSNPDDVFAGCYYTKDNLCERISADKITVHYIAESTTTIKTFEEYYKTIMSAETPVPDRSFLDKVYEFIGNDCEIVINSSIGADIELDKYNDSDFAVISEQLPNDIGKYQGAGIIAHLALYDIRNFKTNEVNSCMFLYYKHADEGLIMIESKYIDRERYNKILKLIMRAQTQ